MHLGFIGLGHIGAPIAQRLLGAGLPLTVHDARSEATAPLIALGATEARVPAELAATCDVVFGCVATVDAYREIVCGRYGLCGGDARMRYYVHLGTTGSACAIELATVLATRNVAMIDAPVTGGAARALQGKLTTMASGARDAFDTVQSLVRTYSSTIVYLSPEPGAAQVMKAINNMLSRINWAAACEAMVMGARAGLDAAGMLEVLNHGSGQNDATLRKMPLALADREIGAALEISRKDLELWRQEVSRLGVHCALGDAAESVYERVLRDARPTDDVLSFLGHVERWAGVRVARTDDPHRRSLEEDPL